MNYYILIFESIHKVMKAEKLLTDAGVPLDIIPTPKEYSSDCGMSIRVLKNNIELEKLKHILTTNTIIFKIK